MEILEFYGTQVNDRHIERAVEVLRDGGIVIYPTDTLYALGCDALNNRAVERLCKIKGINPDKNYLSVVCSGIAQAAEYARIDNRAFRIIKDALPGPYTFILPASTTLPKVFKGRKSVGVRVPDCDIARRLAEVMGNPILSTSVEAEEAEPMTLPSELAEHYKAVADVLLDGGEGRTEGSAIIDLTNSAEPEVVRGHFEF